MATDLKCLRVFIASPGGLGEERQAFRDELYEYNDVDAVERGVVFKPVGWEDTLGGVGRPQTFINEDIRRSDYFVLVLHNRWGSSPDPTDRTDSPFSSACEEELHQALECCRDPDQPMRGVVMLFKAVDSVQLNDPGPQLAKVLAFKQKLEADKEHLYHTFDSTGRFRELLRRHLASWLRGDALPVPAYPSSTVCGTSGAVAGLLGETSPEPPEDPEIQRAWELADHGQLTEAEVVFARASVGRQDAGAFLQYGAFLRRVGRLDQALVMFGQATVLARQGGASSALAEAQVQAAIVCFSRGDLAGAEDLLRKSLTIGERLAPSTRQAQAYVGLANILVTRGDLPGAEDLYRKALMICRGLEDLSGQAGANVGLGIVSGLRGDWAGAEDLLRRAITVWESLESTENQARGYLNLGNSLADRGDLTGAEDLYRKALGLNERLGRLEGQASAYVNLGSVCRARGDLAGAEDLYRQALTIYERLAHLEGQASASVNLGRILHSRGELAGAEDLYRQALALFKRVGHVEGQAHACGNLGDLHRSRGDHADAETMYAAGLTLARSLGSALLIRRFETARGKPKHVEGAKPCVE